MNNYIDTYYNRRNNEVIVWEKTPEGKRLTKRYPAPYYFYVKDDNGEYLSIYNEKLKRLDFPTRARFEEALLQYNDRYESDIDPSTKVLMNNYYGKPTPKLNYTFIDIEVDYNDMARREFNESIRKTVEEINKNERDNWQMVRPLPSNCNQCAILNCPVRETFNKPVVEHSQFETI